MRKEGEVRVVFVGGHHTPALAVIEALEKKSQSSKIKYQIFWIGHKYTLWGDRNPGAEYREVTARGIPFFDLKAGKFYRTFHPLKWGRLPWGFGQAFLFIWRLRPHLLMSFGGYLAVPTALAARLLGIPVLTHEQTLSPGLANRLVALMAKKVFITWPETRRFFPKKKVVFTGNPLRPCLFRVETSLEFPGPRRSRPTLYITGGKQGAHFFNEIVKEALPELLKSYNVIHQCGSASLFNDFARLQGVREKLPENRKDGYLLREYFGEREIGAVYAAASLVISRAGANTICELFALGKPALLIPLPYSSGQEQEKNAQKIAAAGLAEVLPQSQLTPSTLLQKVAAMEKDLARYLAAAAAARRLVTAGADQKIADAIEKTLVLA